MHITQARIVLWSLFEGEDAEEEFERIKTSVADENVCTMFIVEMHIVIGLYIYNDIIDISWSCIQ